ncbi:MAG TPA: SAF domain-containing protein, partial [Rhodothermia bacterium]|nr:SAF domain-containing protein [Rhodothermia bacterium]
RLAATMRAFDQMIGDGARHELSADAATRAVARRSIVAARPLPAGTTLQPSDLDYVRPAGGVPPSEARQLIGRRLRRPVGHHELIQKADVE